MGTVWEGKNLKLESPVAVKMLERGYIIDDKSVSRFKQEAQSAARVSSPHVATVSDYGLTTTGEPYIVMELLQGETLRGCIKRCGALPADDVGQIVEQTARGLAAAHAQGVVHRDIKPENLFSVHNHGALFIKILDFGIAKQMDAPPDWTMRTPTGLMVGTPAYMSPEQYINPKLVNLRTDLWSLGVVAYEAITGTKPFGGDTFYALAVAITAESFAAPSTIVADVPKAIDTWMLKALAKKNEDRFGSAMEMANALIAILNPASVRERRSSLPPIWPPIDTPDDDAPTIAFVPLQRISVKPAEGSDEGPISVGTTLTDKRRPSNPPIVARRGDRNAPPFPRERAPMLIGRTFDAETVSRIEAGIERRTEQDQWFVFAEDNHVFFHRWKAVDPVYEVVLEPTRYGGKRIAQAWVAAKKKATHNAAHLANLLNELFFDDPSASPNSARGDALQPAQRIWVHEGDLTMLAVDALVNSADPSLLGGAGLDGDIHRTAGSGMLAECRALGGCRVGEAKMTKGHSLSAKHVIHTVGPAWRGGLLGERVKLSSCYANSLALASNAGLRTIAFPSISTGGKKFPLEEAAFIAATATLEFLTRRSSVEVVIFCTFTPEHTQAAREGLARAANR
jgi:serine/threonine protein kinase/O-acetyl-ADP-ribose deacetylase (regulator of RNase III)